MIDKIERMTVTSKACTDRNYHVFTLYLEESFSDCAKYELKLPIEDFILTANQQFCSGCYWMVLAYDYDEYWQYNSAEISEMVRQLTSNHPIISYAIMEDFNILLILKEVNESMFNLIHEAELWGGEKMLLDVFDASFSSFNSNNFDFVLENIRTRTIGVDELDELIHKQRIQLEISYFDSLGAKKHDISIKCNQKNSRQVKDCLIKVFKKYGIQLIFFDE